MIITNKRFEILKANYSNFLPNLRFLQEDFGGPSAYFHQQALKESKINFLSERHIEMTYATLTSWGMHRMGKTNTKMVAFSTFKSSVDLVARELKELRHIKLEELTSERDDILKKIQELCFSLKVSVSKSKIVGNSKALAHILPNLTPPIDRKYSISFFAERLTDFKHNEEREFYEHILVCCHQFVQILKNDSRIIIDNDFNTSLPKIFDNLVIVYGKNIKE